MEEPGFFGEAAKSVKAYLSDRTTSPLFGSFVAGWCIWNYKLLLVLFGEGKVEDKLDLLVTLYPSLYDDLCRGLAYPLLTAIGMLLIYPWPAKWFYVYSRTRHNELMEAKLEADRLQPMTRDDSYKLIERHQKDLSAIRTELSETRQENEELKEALAAKPLQAPVPDALTKTSVNRNPEGLSQNALQIVNMLATHYDEFNQGIPVTEFESKDSPKGLGMSRTALTSAFTELTARNYVQRLSRSTDNKGERFELTQPGITYANKLRAAAVQDNQVDTGSFIPVNQAILHVANIIDDKNDDQRDTLFPETRRVLRQAALNNQLRMRGQRQIPGPNTHQTYFDDVQSEIPAEYWDTSVLAPMATDSVNTNTGQTLPKTPSLWGSDFTKAMKQYSNIQVNLDDMQKLWPPS